MFCTINNQQYQLLEGEGGRDILEGPDGLFYIKPAEVDVPDRGGDGVRPKMDTGALEGPFDTYEDACAAF